MAKKRQLYWGGGLLRVCQDLPTEIRIKHAEYDDIRGKLQRAELCYGLLYPSRLIVTIGDIKYIYNNVSDAAEDLKKKLPKVFG